MIDWLVGGYYDNCCPKMEHARCSTESNHGAIFKIGALEVRKNTILL